MSQLILFEPIEDNSHANIKRLIRSISWHELGVELAKQNNYPVIDFILDNLFFSIKHRYDPMGQAYNQILKIEINKCKFILHEWYSEYFNITITKNEVDVIDCNFLRWELEDDWESLDLIKKSKDFVIEHRDFIKSIFA